MIDAGEGWICPGFVDTAMIAPVVGAFDDPAVASALSPASRPARAEEIAAAGISGGVGAGLGAHTGIATPPVWSFGTEEQHERFLRPAIAGERIAALQRTNAEILDQRPASVVASSFWACAGSTAWTSARIWSSEAMPVALKLAFDAVTIVPAMRNATSTAAERAAGRELGSATAVAAPAMNGLSAEYPAKMDPGGML